MSNGLREADELILLNILQGRLFTWKRQKAVSKRNGFRVLIRRLLGLYRLLTQWFIKFYAEHISHIPVFVIHIAYKQEGKQAKPCFSGC